MRISFLQLNIEKGRCIEEVIAYIKTHDIDILHLQEAASGALSKNKDIFHILKKELAYEGTLAPDFRIADRAHTYFGNATLWKDIFTPTLISAIPIKPYKEYTEESYNHMADTAGYEDVPRHVLRVHLTIEDKTIHLFNSHLVWGPVPTDEPYKWAQHEKILRLAHHMHAPFILSGDFNVTPNTRIVQELDRIGHNVVGDLGFPNTLNPRLHRAKHLFPKGLCVDYVYVNSSMTVYTKKLIDTPDLSDHFGIYMECELQ